MHSRCTTQPLLLRECCESRQCTLKNLNSGDPVFGETEDEHFFYILRGGVSVYKVQKHQGVACPSDTVAQHLLAGVNAAPPKCGSTVDCLRVLPSRARCDHKAQPHGHAFPLDVLLRGTVSQ